MGWSPAPTTPAAPVTSSEVVMSQSEQIPQTSSMSTSPGTSRGSSCARPFLAATILPSPKARHVELTGQDTHCHQIHISKRHALGWKGAYGRRLVPRWTADISSGYLHLAGGCRAYCPVPSEPDPIAQANHWVEPSQSPCRRRNPPMRPPRRGPAQQPTAGL